MTQCEKRLVKNHLKKTLLGEIPINLEVGKSGDEEKLIVEANLNHKISKIYLELASKIKSSYFGN